MKSSRLFYFLAVSIALLFGRQALLAEEPASAAPSEPGIPVTNKLVVQKCGPCHAADAAGDLSRISWVRTTPEGWEEVIKRMVRLNHVTLSQAEAREILDYLATDHGLAPEEAKPVMYFAEHRVSDENIPEPVKDTCNACHAYGKAASWRRSKEEWDLLYQMHVGYFPSSQMTTFMRPPLPPGSPPPAPGTDMREPYQKALDYLKTAFPLYTPEWAAFRTTIQRAKVTGRWLVAAYKPGEGAYYGEMTVAETSDPSIFTTQTRLVSANSGTVVNRTGKVAVYEGYAWRGRSESKDSGSGPAAAADVRQIMMLSRDQSQAGGRWIWGDYQEFGFEVRMYRAKPGLMLLGLNTFSLKTNATHTVEVFGDGFTNSLKPSDFDFGGGVSLSKISRVSRSEITLDLAVAKDAVPGKRDISVAGTVLPAAFTVYDHIDYIKISPETALSRLGGGSHAKGYVQFEAIGYQNGPDKKPNTPDDVPLGAFRAKWSIKEFYATYGDDDIKYVGSLNSETGLFTPAVDGPNPARRFSRNNYGDVWVEAEVDKDLPAPAAGDTPRPLTARSYLVVTIPQYLRYDQPEVAP